MKKIIIILIDIFFVYLFLNTIWKIILNLNFHSNVEKYNFFGINMSFNMNLDLFIASILSLLVFASLLFISFTFSYKKQSILIALFPIIFISMLGFSKEYMTMSDEKINCLKQIGSTWVEKNNSDSNIVKTECIPPKLK